MSAVPGTNNHNNEADCQVKPSLGLALRDVMAQQPEALALTKKRKVGTGEQQHKVNLSSYNSAFLEGLFEDVAHVVHRQVGETGEMAQTDATGETEHGKNNLTTEDCCQEELANPQEQESPSPFKRRRVSNVKSLDDVCHQEEGDSSLWFKASLLPPPRSTTHMDLPVAVSDSFASQQELTRNRRTSSFASLLEDNTDEEEGGFGWYVDMDGSDKDSAETTSDPYAKTGATSLLAFSAPAAPKQRSSYDAELEYALAADTVDDVLGDFF